ncbi:hypothetical protein Y032_0163g3506 [Ancylostoma ceylanicum]|uniref:Peptidase A1 domain-containing protein n=1 Tax=Ancylostoma ceylanicum TaxID=53326 RepID=A0A016SXM3_9BILA|nr:hypothetical protein Y032_0163g3506 [Ancylostoma ceylanicum]
MDDGRMAETQLTGCHSHTSSVVFSTYSVLKLEMLVIFALLTLLGCTQPAQHKMQLRKITPEMVKMLRKGTWAKYVDEVHKQQQHAHQMDSDGKYEYDVIGYSDIEYIGEVTIGTPEQRFLVLIDTGTTYLWVPDKSCYKQTNRPSECQSSLCDPGSICDVFCSERSCCSLGANDTSNPCRLKRRYDMEKSSSYSKTASRFMIRKYSAFYPIICSVMLNNTMHGGRTGEDADVVESAGQNAHSVVIFKGSTHGNPHFRGESFSVWSAARELQ